MAKEMTVYEFAKVCMKDEEFNRGGVVANERKYLDAIGFKYTVEDGQVMEYGEDLDKFFKAMVTLSVLNNKYSKRGK